MIGSLIAATWVPILEPAASARAAEVLDAIAAAMRAPPPPYDGRLADDALAVALFGRESGFALFHAYLAAATGEEADADRARDCLAIAVDALPRALERPYFSYGFTGLAWALQHLDWLTEADEDGLADLDAIVGAIVESPARSRDFGLSKGLVGYAVYAQERMPRPRARATLARVVGELVAHAERTPAGLAWRLPAAMLTATVVRDHPEGIVPFGVLDGAAGVIATLAAAAAVGAEPAVADEAIAAALGQLRAHLVGDGDDVRLPGIAGGKPVPPSWAYGEAGVAAALVATERPDCVELGLMLGRAAAGRPPSSEVRDASLGRGTAGVAHAFNRLYQATGDERFLAAARAWFDATLAHYELGRGFGGYRFWAEEWIKEYIPELDVGWVDQPGLSEGVVGVGLALLAATTSIAPAWDRVLLLSRVTST